MKGNEAENEKKIYEWKSATVAFSPCGREMNSWPAPLMTVRGTSFPDTVDKAMSAKSTWDFEGTWKVTH